MKNWCKIIETDENQILVTKDFDHEEDVYQISVRISVDGIGCTQSMGYQEEHTRDKRLDGITDDQYIQIAENMRSILL